MRLHFQENPWDLYVAVGYTAAIVTVLFALNVGNILAVLFVLFLPGYLLTAALFPKNTEIDWIERIALSLGLSIAVVPLLGLLLNFTPFGVRFVPIVGTIALFTTGVGYAAYWRRMRLAPDLRLSLTMDVALPGWKDHNPLDKGLALAFAVSIVVAGAIVTYVVLTPRPAETFTEFYLLGPGGNASGYPKTLNVSEPGTVILGVVNHESATINYMIRVDLVGVNLVFNATCNCNQTQEVNRTAFAWLNRNLDEKENWTQRYTFWINSTGLWQLEFRLYKNAILTAQELRLFIRVL